MTHPWFGPWFYRVIAGSLSFGVVFNAGTRDWADLGYCILGLIAAQSALSLHAGRPR